MRGRGITGGLAVLVAAALASSGGAAGFAPAVYCPAVPVYYPVARVVYYPVVRTVVPVAGYCAPVVPVVASPQPFFATPRPAPPSETTEPPTNSAKSRAPTITESRSPGRQEPAKPAADPTPKDKVRVGFWNLTGRDVTLQVDGEKRRLEQDRAITLHLPRSFTWQINGQEPRQVRVAAERKSYEVILRD